jgi:hypothetical protein
MTEKAASLGSNLALRANSQCLTSVNVTAGICKPSGPFTKFDESWTVRHTCHRRGRGAKADSQCFASIFPLAITEIDGGPPSVARGLLRKPLPPLQVAIPVGAAVDPLTTSPVKTLHDNRVALPVLEGLLFGQGWPMKDAPAVFKQPPGRYPGGERRSRIGTIPFVGCCFQLKVFHGWPSS